MMLSRQISGVNSVNAFKKGHGLDVCSLKCLLFVCPVSFKMHCLFISNNVFVFGYITSIQHYMQYNCYCPQLIKAIHLIYIYTYICVFVRRMKEEKQIQKKMYYSHFCAITKSVCTCVTVRLALRHNLCCVIIKSFYFKGLFCVLL